MLLLDAVKMLFDSLWSRFGAEDFVEMDGDDVVFDFGIALGDDEEEHLSVNVFWWRLADSYICMVGWDHLPVQLIGILMT